MQIISYCLLFCLIGCCSQRSLGQGLPRTLSDTDRVMGIAIGSPVRQVPAFTPIDSTGEKQLIKKMLIFYKVQYLYEGPPLRLDNGQPLKYLACSVSDSGKIIALHLVLEDSPQLLPWLEGRYGPSDQVTGAGGADNSYFWYQPLRLYYLTQPLFWLEDKPANLEVDRLAILTFSKGNKKQFVFDPTKDASAP